MVIRKMDREDIEQVVDINISCWKKIYRGIIDDKYLDLINKSDRVKKNLERYGKIPYIVAVDNGKIVGFCSYSDCRDKENYPKYDAEIITLYVNPNMLRQGIGNMLFNYVLEEFKSQGKSKMIIWCLKKNYNSRKFYEKMGGNVIGEKLIHIGEKEYEEVAYGYDISKY